MILPCPFCGSEASVEEVDGQEVPVFFSVGCSSPTEPACMGYQSLTMFNTRGEAIAAWNRRSNEIPEETIPIHSTKEPIPEFRNTPQEPARGSKEDWEHAERVLAEVAGIDRDNTDCGRCMVIYDEYAQRGPVKTASDGGGNGK